MKIGNQIRSIREKKGISSKQLASNLDIDLSTLNRIENGKINKFDPEFLEKIAHFLGINISELFGKDNTYRSSIKQEAIEQFEKIEEIYEKLLAAKEKENVALKEQIQILKTKL
ncbi:helix-turn-helix domain-containing protein [Emticicia sp. CRIBPO]|uniref:helix-turn-helix domain-containing protein n=1 Tax=Emticicia sp. CRIBPO TaxID=2683258 RepID=UPI0014122C3F|nr:helix-turn-helix transcriptional regulator [Emticicia sp. CRIBPO]NBA87201.1 helix-turn-helix domain-containing protein [Emticicia sp. CRIBPO]